jgi:hypothetical protein
MIRNPVERSSVAQMGSLRISVSFWKPRAKRSFRNCAWSSVAKSRYPNYGRPFFFLKKKKTQLKHPPSPSSSKKVNYGHVRNFHFSPFVCFCLFDQKPICFAIFCQQLKQKRSTVAVSIQNLSLTVWIYTRGWHSDTSDIRPNTTLWENALFHHVSLWNLQPGHLRTCSGQGAQRLNGKNVPVS